MLDSDVKLSRSLQEQPFIFHLISTASLLIAKDIRKEFVNLTDNITSEIRDIFTQPGSPIKIHKVNPPHWKDIKGEIVSFIDGGVGQIEIFSKIPLIIRSGIFKVITGERNLDEREKFKIYPCLVGDLEDVKKDSKDYIAVARIIIELLSALKVIVDNEFNDTDILLLHGPLVHRMSQYSPHYIGEKDIKRILVNSHSDTEEYASNLILNFRTSCKTCSLKSTWCDDYKQEEKMSAVCFIKYLIETIFTKSKEKKPHHPLVYSAVERSRMTEFSIKIILPELYHKNQDLLKKFNIPLTGNIKKDIKNIIKKSNYHDALLLSLILEEGEYTEPFIAKEIYSGYKSDFKDMGQILKKNLGIKYSYLKIKQNTFPIRIEFPSFLLDDEIRTVMNRAYMYSKLLPNYAFPIGLDIVDKFAKVPLWMTEAFRKLIIVKLNVEASNENEEMFRRMMNIILLQKRDWQYRPKV